MICSAPACCAYSGWVPRNCGPDVDARQSRVWMACTRFAELDLDATDDCSRRGDELERLSRVLGVVCEGEGVVGESGKVKRV